MRTKTMKAEPMATMEYIHMLVSSGRYWMFLRPTVSGIAMVAVVVVVVDGERESEGAFWVSFFH